MGTLKSLLLIALWAMLCSPNPVLAADPLETISVNGAELHYQLSGKGNTIVFVHGGLVDYREFQPIAADLNSKYQTIVYSRRYNFPNKNDLILSNFSARTEADDLAALIQSFKLKDVTVVGASYGAYTALMLALHHSDVVKRLVLIEPPLLHWLHDIPGGPAVREDFDKRLWIPVGKALKQDQSDLAIQIALEFFLGPDAMNQIPAEFVEMIRANLKEWKMLTQSTDVFPAVTREELRRIQKPVLMLSGGNSYAIGKLLDPEIQKQLPDVVRVTIPGGTHDVCSELPDLCAKEILQFLKTR
jgi:pimeloyl-ACP methyl ester carboxylesterase